MMDLPKDPCEGVCEADLSIVRSKNDSTPSDVGGRARGLPPHRHCLGERSPEKPAATIRVWRAVTLVQVAISSSPVNAQFKS